MAKKSVVNGALALSVAGILSKVISIFYQPFLINILGDSGYGMYTQVMDVYLFIYAITTAGAQPAVAKVVSEYNALHDGKPAKGLLGKSIRLYLIIGIIGSIALFFLAYPMAAAMDSDIAIAIMVLSPCIFATCVLAACRGFVQGNNIMQPIAVSQVIEQFVNVILSLLCAYVLMHTTHELNLGVAGAQVGTSVGALAAIFCVVIAYKKSYDEDKLMPMQPGESMSKKLLSYSIPIVMSSGLQNLGGLVDAINVKGRLLFAGFDSDQANALYGFSSKYKTLVGVPMVVIIAISTIILPALSSARATGNMKKVSENIKWAYKIVLAISVPVAIGLSTAAVPLYKSLYGNDNGKNIMVMGSFILILMALSQIQLSILQGINGFYYLLATSAIGIVFKIVLNYIFVGIAEINIYGFLIGNCVWYLIPVVLNHIKIKGQADVKLRENIFKPVIASLIMGGVVLLIGIPFRNMNAGRILSIVELVLEAGIGIIVYGILMLLIGGITKEDLQMISPKLYNKMPGALKRRIK